MKYLDFNIALKSTNPQKQTTRPKVFTNDLDSVMIRVTITDMTDTDLLGSSAEMLLYMQDRSFFQNTDVTREGNVFKYLLKENEGNHAGIARFQLPVKTADGKTYAQQKLEFEIESGLETKVATEVMIHDWTSLTREARAYIDEFKLLVDDAKEQVRANIVETAVEEKFNNLEQEYATDLTQVKSQLADDTKHIVTRLIPNNDYNQAIELGFYQGPGSLAINGAPIGSTAYGVLLVQKRSNTIQQIAVYNYAMSMRSTSDGGVNWTAWRTLDISLIIYSANSPEGVHTAPPGTLFLRSNGGANTSLYVKESGTGNTGWVAK